VFAGEPRQRILGTVVETTWNGVTIDWDDGNRTSIQHNDMMHVERVPMKV
jgi:hypothetical protein